MATLLPGYRRLPGSDRAYVTPWGERISYRQYRKAAEAAGAVRRLDVASLANRRLSQARFNSLIKQMSDVRRRAIDIELNQIEYMMDEAIDEGIYEEAEEAMEAMAERMEELRRARRTVKRTAITGEERKRAQATLQLLGHPHTGRGRKRRPRARTAAEEAELIRALEILGRREGIPHEWAVGSYDRKTGLQLQRAA